MTPALILAAALATSLPSPFPSPSVTMTPSPSVAETPSAVPTPSPNASGTPPSATPSPTPTATPVYKYRVVPSPNPSAASDEPAILEIDLNDKKLAPHGKIAMRVLTTPNVVKVVTRSNGRDGVLQQTAPGEFVANGSIPGIPFLAHGWKINLEFVASTADGRTTSVKVPVTLG